MPTSMTAAPGLIQEPRISCGWPIAATTMSAVRTMSASPLVCEWHTVTVAFSRKSSCDTGRPYSGRRRRRACSCIATMMRVSRETISPLPPPPATRLRPSPHAMQACSPRCCCGPAQPHACRPRIRLAQGEGQRRTAQPRRRPAKRVRHWIEPRASLCLAPGGGGGGRPDRTAAHQDLQHALGGARHKGGRLVTFGELACVLQVKPISHAPPSSGVMMPTGCPAPQRVSSLGPPPSSPSRPARFSVLPRPGSSVRTRPRPCAGPQPASSRARPYGTAVGAERGCRGSSGPH